MNYDYLSINKEQSLKAILMDSRTEFLAWFSALRWAKSNHDLTVAFHNPQATDKKLCVYQASLSNRKLEVLIIHWFGIVEILPNPELKAV